MTVNSGRSSIFETFLKSVPKGESSSKLMPSFGSNGSSLFVGRVPPGKTGSFVATDDAEEYKTEQEPTLWMSCSPGHDGSDNDSESLTVDSGDVRSDDDDDELPTSQMTGRCMFKTDDCWSSGDRRLDEVSSMKSRPKMPVSAYALFYNDAKAAIVGANPKAEFSKIAQIVATMWDHLDEESKVDYKRKASSRRNFAKRSTSERSIDPDTQIKPQERKVAKNSLDQNEQAQGMKPEQSCPMKFSGKERPFNVADTDTKDAGQHISESSNDSGKALSSTMEVEVDLTVLCRRPDCLNIAVDNPRWSNSNDYCSSQCVVTHCKDIFNAWVSERQGILQICESRTHDNPSDRSFVIS